MVDINQNGFLSLEELSEVLKKRGFTRKQCKKIFEGLNLIDDNNVTLDEFMKGMSRLDHFDINKATLRAVFYDFDKDNSGEIDKKELDSVFDEMGKHFTQEELVRMIGLADKDGDGKMNIEEFMQKVFNTSAE